MKKISIAVIFSLMYLLNFAQQGIEFGIRFIPLASGIINDDDFAEGEALDFDRTFGLAYGLEFGYNFSDNIGIRTNLILSSQGEKYKGNMPVSFDITKKKSYATNLYLYQGVKGENYNAEVKLNYLRIPLLLKFNSEPSNGAFFLFYVGPEFNLLYGARHLVNGKEIDYNKLGGLRTKDLYKSSVLSAVLGIGAGISISDNLKIDANFRFDYALGDIENKDAKYSIFPGINTNYWPSGRASSSIASAGFVIGLTYVLEQ